MEYLMVILVFGGIGAFFVWGLNRNLWKVDGCSGCSVHTHFDREQAMQEEEEARRKKYELKRIKNMRQ
jgi:hypothetical protein